MQRVWWWLLPVLVIAGLWAWLTPRAQRPDTATSTDTAADEELGFAATDAELIETGADGALLYRLRARRIAQQRPDAEVLLTGPQLSYDLRSQGAWTLQAEYGTLSADRQSVAFAGAVRARRAQPHAPLLDLRTEALQVDLKRRLADTAVPVAIEWGRARLSASGLHADMVSGLFVLNGNGRGSLHY
jgi:LPS export ABC transporter protein LptC